LAFLRQLPVSSGPAFFEGQQLMADFLTTLNRNPLTAPLAKALGLPNPVPLARSATGYEAAPFAGKAVLLQAAPNSYAQAALLQALRNAGGEPVAPGLVKSSM
jgi:3-oxoacyl-[acyl-carrier protein] reductase